MRQGKVSPVKKIQQPEPPTAPRARSLGAIGRSIVVAPYFLQGNPELTDSTGRTDFTSDGQLAVAIGPLSIKNIRDYELIYGESIYKVVARILSAINVEYYIRNPEQAPEGFDLLANISETGRIITPYGELETSLEIAMAELFAFIASCRGLVTGYLGSSELDLTWEPMTIEEIIDIMNPGAILEVDQATGKHLFFEILNLANLYSEEDAKQALKEEGEITPSEDDELKNLAEKQSVE